MPPKLFQSPISSSSEEDSVDFSPKRNDETDESTASLFEQLEEGFKYCTNIQQCLDSGANLYAVRVGGDYDGSYPIHIAASNYSANTEALGIILRSFSNPHERKAYINLCDGSDKNVADILLRASKINLDYIQGLEELMSYLTQQEQQYFLKQNAIRDLNDNDVTQEDEVEEDDELEDFENLDLSGLLFDGRKFVEPCAQRKAEEDLQYDSDDEALGAIEEVESAKGFVARVWYKEILVAGLKKSVPMMELIPSGWRLETSTEGKQGDHVIAYVLLLNSLSHCRGANIKTLPKHFCEMASAVLPDFKDQFEKDRKAVESELQKKRAVRKDTVARMKHFFEKDPQYLITLEDSLKKAEIEEVARYLEAQADLFISCVNKMKGESFSQERKKDVNAEGFLTRKMLLLVDSEPKFAGANFANFRQKLKATISAEIKSGTLTETDISRIAKKFIKALVPATDKILQGFTTIKSIEEFLPTITPLKKYHEGIAITKIKKLSDDLAVCAGDERKRKIKDIGKICAQLIDYPRVDKVDKFVGLRIDRVDDEYVLYEAIPRHMIICIAAFPNLRTLSGAEKDSLYDSFLDQVLKLQLWEGHPVTNSAGVEVEMTKVELMEGIAKFSTRDAAGNFVMKPEAQHPNHQYSSKRKAEAVKVKDAEAAAAAPAKSVAPKSLEKVSSKKPQGRSLDSDED